MAKKTKTAEAPQAEPQEEPTEPAPEAPAPTPALVDEIVYPPFNELTFFIYGKQGSGKTTFFGKTMKALIVACENGAQFQRCQVRQVFRWERDLTGEDKRRDFCTLVQSIIAAKQSGKLAQMGVSLIVIDTIDRLLEMARVPGTTLYMKEHPKGGFYAHPDAVPFGGATTYGLRLLKEQLDLLRAHVPIACISHEEIRTEEVENASGIKSEIEMRVPSLHHKTSKWLAGEQNLVGYAYKDPKGGFLIKFHSDPRLETKDRTGLLAAYKKPFPTDWATVEAAYNAQAEKEGIILRSQYE